MRTCDKPTRWILEKITLQKHLYLLMNQHVIGWQHGVQWVGRQLARGLADMTTLSAVRGQWPYNVIYAIQTDSANQVLHSPCNFSRRGTSYWCSHKVLDSKRFSVICWDVAWSNESISSTEFSSRMRQCQCPSFWWATCYCWRTRVPATLPSTLFTRLQPHWGGIFSYEGLASRESGLCT